MPPVSTERAPRGPLALAFLLVLAALAFAGFVALGTWQVHRRAWKLDLIARVDQRVHAPAETAPGPENWPQVTAERDEYRHVRLTGSFLYDRQTLVWASTELGSGYWVMTPLRLAGGAVVLINRGYVPMGLCPHAASCVPGPAGEATITGLLRMPETRTFLRHNDPAQDRWYARDVQAIAAARSLGRVAPYFVDADASPIAGAAPWPRGGLTVISFPNNHLVYLLTWYALALMVVVAAICLVRHEWKLRHTQAA